MSGTSESPWGVSWGFLDPVRTIQGPFVQSQSGKAQNPWRGRSESSHQDSSLDQLKCSLRYGNRRCGMGSGL